MFHFLCVSMLVPCIVALGRFSSQNQHMMCISQWVEGAGICAGTRGDQKYRVAAKLTSSINFLRILRTISGLRRVMGRGSLSHSPSEADFATWHVTRVRKKDIEKSAEYTLGIRWSSLPNDSPG